MRTGEQKTYIDAPEVMLGVHKFLEELEHAGIIKIINVGRNKQGLVTSVTIEKL